jgi:hypothetical protein
MLDLDKLKKWLDSEEGQLELSNYANSLVQERKIKDLQLERFNFKFSEEENFKLFVELVIQKYKSPEYKNRWFKRGIEPPNGLFWFLFEYAEKYGRECSEEEWTDYSNAFTADLFYVNGYYFNLMHGQGSIVQIISK